MLVVTTTQQGYGCLLWPLQGGDFAAVPTSLPFKLRLTHGSHTVRCQSRDPWHPLASHQHISFGGEEGGLFTLPMLVPPCSPDARWGSSSCSTETKSSCTPPRRGLQSHLSWARACHVISSPPPTYCTLLQQPPLGGVRGSWATAWGWGESWSRWETKELSETQSWLESSQRDRHICWISAPRSCTSKKATDSTSTPRAAITEITQINNPAKTFLFICLSSYKTCSSALELLIYGG